MQTWLFLHYMGQVMWLGAGLGSMVYGIVGKKESGAALAVIARGQVAVHKLLIGPGAFLMILSGVMLSLRMYGSAMSGMAPTVWMMVMQVAVAAEQRALEQARLVVWMHPLFWYSVPALLKHWIDKVLAYGWAYGEGGTALSGKHCLWVPTTGGNEQAYTPSGIHAHPFAAFVPAIEQTARFCGMRWEPPHVVHDANAIDEARLAGHVARLRERLAPWREPHRV